MKQIRVGVFETNSSSTHSLTLCSKETYEKWGNGEVLFDRWDDKFVPATEELLADNDRYETRDGFYDSIQMETFHQEYTTENGDTVVAFGYYGYDN